MVRNSWLSGCLLVGVLSGCVSMPQWVKDRPAYSQFNPSGNWQATGQALRAKAATVHLSLKLEPGRKTFDIALADGQPLAEVYKGRALVDGDWVYTLTSDNIGANGLYVYTVGADQMDGLRVSKVLGFQHAVRTQGTPADPIAGVWKTEGVRDDGGSYSGEVIFSKVGDHYSMKSTTGQSQYDGVGFLSEGKLVVSSVTSVSVREKKRLVGMVDGLGVETTTTRSAHTAHFVLGAYRNEGNVLKGRTLYGSNEEGDMNREEEKVIDDEWTRATP